MAEFRKWRMDFEDAGGQADRRHVPDPPGFDPAAGREVASGMPVSTRNTREMMAAKQQALNSRATSQLKTVGFLCFMMWMSGNTIHLFSIMTTMSGIYQPLMAIIKSADMFPEEASEGDYVSAFQMPKVLEFAGGGLPFR
ncbi:hypothetical protein WJX72_006491 [[Myrmecia] bisecta]|uniref:ER membrane protein complex subunit 4 n=1 Tax=[Myrmecia] bisecta TaxID=41462 RepID=A0AAW1R6U6_9CHLO